MKPVILIVDGSEKYDAFDTVKEAQDFTADMVLGERFEIFTLYNAGIRPPITWKIETGHVTNVRENKKAEKAGRKGPWTDIELETLIANYEAGMSMTDIANGLKRKYNSIYVKIKELKKNGRL